MAKNIWDQREGVTASYVEWFVTQQSGNRELAEKLVADWSMGWNLILGWFREGLAGQEVAEKLTEHGFNTVLATKGLSQFNLPGQTASFLIMDRECGCEQITWERWTSESDVAANIVIIGMGEKDLKQEQVAEKQIHMAAFELPRRHDYLDFRTNSISPLAKGIIAFTAVGLLTGCEPKASSPPPPPPPPPAPPTDPQGKPGQHQVTTSEGVGDAPNAPTIPITPQPSGPGVPTSSPQGIPLPTGRDSSGNPTIEHHTQVGVRTNVDPSKPSNDWHWFWVFLTNVKQFQAGCCFVVEVQKSVWLNGGQPQVEPWHVDNPLPNNFWVDQDGLHILDTPGYPANKNNPAPYNGVGSIGKWLSVTDHVIVTWYFRLTVWCSGDSEATEYKYSVTMEIERGVVNSTSERPRQTNKRPITSTDRSHAICLPN
jgi:hypothetical protein